MSCRLVFAAGAGCLVAGCFAWWRGTEAFCCTGPFSVAAGTEVAKSKYPPAKPGALRCEPLKAAYPGGFGVVSHLLRGMRHQVPKLTILKHAHLHAPLFAAA